MVTINWSERARENLDQIFNYIARDSPMNAKLFVQKIYSKAQILQRLPDSGRMVPEMGDPCIRELIVRGYRIIYQQQSGMITILTVQHGRQILKL